MTDSVSSLLARVAVLEAALRPFAEMAPIYALRPDSVRLLSAATGDITVGDLRRARAALVAVG